MNRDSVTRLRLDRRLLFRRGWLSPEERERELEALPDVSSKATTLGAIADRDTDAEPGGRGEGPETSAPA